MSQDQPRIFISESLQGKVDEKLLINIFGNTPEGWHEEPKTHKGLRYFCRVVGDVELLVVYEMSDDKFSAFIGSGFCGTTDSLPEACSLAERVFCGCHVRKSICTDAR